MRQSGIRVTMDVKPAPIGRVGRGCLLFFCALFGLWPASVHASTGDSIIHTFGKDTLLVHPHGQDTLITAKDSTTAKPVRKKSSQNDTWFYGYEPNKRYLIDSTIAKLHYYDLAHRDGAEYFNMGNTGTEMYPIIFNPSSSVGFNMGFHQFDGYKYYKDSIRYYQVIRPYAEIFYDLSINKEQLFQGRFANVHKKSGILYGVDFRRINSNGTYTNQKTIDNGFSLYGIYNSKSKVFSIETDMIYNSFVVQENGGLDSDIFFHYTPFLTKTLAPTYLANAILNYNEIDWFLKATYNVGKKYNERVNDTLVRHVVLPVFKVSYQFDVERDKYSYFDINNDSAYYSLNPYAYSAINAGNPYYYTSGPLYLNMGDTLRYTSKLIKEGQRFGLDYDAKKLTSDSTFKELNFLMGAAIDLDYYTLSEFDLKEKFTNLYITGYLKSNPAVNSRLIYNASVAYYIAGYNQNDLSADGKLGVDLRQFGRLTAGVSYQLKQSDYIYHSFRADSSTGIPTTNPNGTITYVTHDNLAYAYLYNLPKMSTFKFGGEYLLAQYGIKLSAYNYVMDNYFYFSAPNQPAVVKNAINMLVLSFSNRFGFKGIHFDNDVWFQRSDGSDAIRLPLVALKSSLYYQRLVFKNILLFAFGADVRYYTPFYANGYNPLTGQFYEQDYQQMKFYPILDLFLNFKIKTVRLFLEGTNISSLFGPQKGYYTALYYPAQDVTFKFGAAWRFFE